MHPLTSPRIIRLRLAAILSLIICAAGAPTLAQTSTTYSSTDGKTPAGMQTGSPSGSYALSGFDNVNPFNGSLSFQLPLLRIGGRGSAGYTMTLPIERKWRVEHTIVDPNLYCESCDLNPVTHTYMPTDQPWGTSPGYGAGILQGRRSGWEPMSCGGTKINTWTLTRLTFTAADGTQYELRDQLYYGKPLPGTCGTPTSRGTVFITADGSSATFISDTAIQDYSLVNDYPPISPTGDLLLRDGTRFRIEGGSVVWIRDPQGNRVTIGATQITDSVNRNVSISYHTPSVTYDDIIFAGVGGAERHIRIHYASLSNRLRSGYSIESYSALFALSNNNSAPYNPEVVASVELPNGRSYNFFYNSYGELARVELPTGGAFEYDYQSSDGVVNLGARSADPFGLVTEYEIHRRVTVKRVFGAEGLERVIVFSGGSTGNNTEALVTHSDGNGNWLAGTRHHYYGTAEPSLSHFSRPTDYSRWDEGKEYKTEVLALNGVMRSTEQTWQQQAPSWWNSSYGPEPSNNPRLVTTVTTVEPASANLVTKQTAINPLTGAVGFDQFNNQTDVWEYGFEVGTPSAHPVRHTHTDYLVINPANSIDYTATSVHMRSLPVAQQVYAVNATTGSETLVAQSETKYDETSLLPWYGTVQGWADPGTARGNPTKMRSWLNPGNTWLERRTQFDQVGNLTKTWDGNNNQTEISYSSIYHYAYPTQTTSAIPDPTGQHGSNTPLISTSVYDLATGLVTSTTDANGVVSNVQYNDQLNRPTKAIIAVGTAAQAQTTIEYDDANRLVTTTTDQSSYNDNALKSQVVFDGLGRTTESRQYEGATNYVVVRTQYDGLGRPYKVSNSYRPWKSESAIWTTTGFDALGRVILVTTPDNAVVSTAYAGNTVTVTDQAGKTRKSVTDALGRLTKVYEDPSPSGLNYLTNYDYDALDNLTTVTQGTQTRSFIYDSLKRLTSANNPESGTIAYTYDNNSNLLTKIDARSITSTFTYDALNRPVTRSYSDSTPTVVYNYDSATLSNGIGRLKSVSSSISSYGYSGYDATGKALGATQTIGTQTYAMGYTYDLAGQVKTMTYPSGHVVSYNYDAAARLADKDALNPAFSGNLGDGMQRMYASELEYSSANGLQQEKFGTTTPIYHKQRYNVRGQLWDIRVSTASFSADPANGDRGAIVNYYNSNFVQGGSSTDNNGNLLRQENYIPGSSFFQDNFSYDALNRLTSIAEKLNGTGADSFKQAYTYDRWANRTVDQVNTTSNVPKPNFGVDTTTNRLTAPAGYTMSYDQAGNLTNDTYSGEGARTYDAENRMKQAWANGQWQTYGYDGDGHRVKRNVNGTEIWQVYGLGGELLAEYAANAAAITPQKEYGYRNGQLLITADTTTVPAPILYDEFNDNSLDTSRWTVIDPNSTAVVSEQAQQLRITLAANSSGYNGVSSNATYDLTGKSFQVEVAQPVSQSGYAENFIELAIDQNNYFMINAGAGSMVMRSMVGGISDQTYVPIYDPTIHRHWRLRHNPSTNVINFETSSDGTIWTTRKTASVGFSLTTLRVYLFAGAWGTGNSAPGAVKFDNLKIGLTGGAQSVTWTNVVGVSAVGNSLTKTAADGWNGGASSTQSIAVGDGFVEFIANETNKHRMLGLSHGDGDQSYQDIDFAIYPNDQGQLWVYEGGTSRGQVGTYSTQDALRVSVEGGVVKYRKNGSLLYTSTLTPTYPLLVDTWMYSNGATISGVMISSSAISTVANIEWLVADHLGTPRMVIDQTGSAASVKRHDYLPFGEELLAGQGGRTTSQGYTGDNIRQKFTSKERDNETGMDYFGARYYASSHGRFTSVDPFMLTIVRLYDPQRINLFSYCRSNPLKYLDPDGRDLVFANNTAMERGKANMDARLRADERANLEVVGNQVRVKDPKAVDLANATNAYKGLVAVIENPKITVNYYGLKPGQTEKLREPVTEATGEVRTEVTYNLARERSGWTAFYNYSDGTSVYDVFVAAADDMTVEGVSGEEVPMPESISFYHEAAGHPRLDDEGTIDYENSVRQDRGVSPMLPRRSGNDHTGGFRNNMQVFVNSSPDLIPVRPIQINTTQPAMRPIIKQP